MFDGNDWATEIKAYRLRHSLKQEALAYLLDVDATTVSRWERGRDKPSLMAQCRLRKLIAPTPTIATLGLCAIIDATSDIAVLMDRDYRMVRASDAHRRLLRYDLSDVAGVPFPMWTDAMFATLEPFGGPKGWWTNGVRRITFDIVRKPLERALNPAPIYQKVTTLTVHDSAGDPMRFAITRTIAEADFQPGASRVEFF
jgi:DNA-binding XRE family transcriptional regulator